MTIHKKGTVSKMKSKEKSEAATTSDVSTTETVEVVSSTSVVEESSQVVKSESKSSTEVTSASREVIMDSKGNVIKVIETPPQTVQRTSASRRTGKSSQDFIAGEQTQSIKQAKTTHETPRENVKSLSESRVLQGGTIEESVQIQSASASSTVQESVSSSTVVESSSTSVDRSERWSADDVKAGDHSVPGTRTLSRSAESTRVSSETSEAITKDGQTISNTTRIRETGDRIEDNGGTTATSSREVDNERTITPSSAAAVKITDDTKSGDKSARSESRSNVELSTQRCNKPGQSAWDGTFVYEKPVTPENRSGKTAVSKSHGGTQQSSETSVKVTQKASTSKETIDRIVSSSVTRDTKTTKAVDEGYVTSRDAASSEKITSSDDIATDLAGERYPRGPARRSKPGDSAWDGSFIVEKTMTQPRARRNDSDTGVFRHAGDNVAETTQRRDFKEKSADGTYERESSETMRVVKGATDSTRFISEERRDVSRESSIRVDGTPSEEHRARASSPSHRGVARPGDSTWNGEFVCEKPREDARKRHPSEDLTVVRRTEKRHDSVDIEDVTEDVSNVSESVSTSYVVEYAISSDKKNVEKVTSVSETILEEDISDERATRGPVSPEKQPRRDAGSRCYKPGQSTWDGTFVYEQPKTPESRRKPDDGRVTRTLDIRDVTEDKSINETDVTSTSYIVEHSSSQQSFSDVKDASLTSTIYETVVYEGRPVETTIRFDKDTSRSRVPTTDRRTSPSPRPASPEKTPRDLRSAKPGSSTWDGTFVAEKPREKKRPPSRESADDDRLPDKSRPVDSGKTRPADTSKKHEIVDLRNVTRDSSSEIAESSVVVEQSTTRESYKDSGNLDYSTTSIETVVIRDGQPVTTQKTVTIEEGGPVERPAVGDAITESAVKSPSERKEPRGSDKSHRSTKPGSSTWDGTFVYEKPGERKPVDKKTPKDTAGTADKPSPTKKEKPIDTADRKTITILETSDDVTSTVDASSVTIEQTLVTESKTTRDASDLTRIVQESGEDKTRSVDYERPKPSPRQRPEDAGRPKDEKPRESSVDRAYRPTKPGASTWDGSFVYEKPEERKPSDKKTHPKDAADKSSPLKGKPSPSDVTGRKTVAISETSTDVTSSADYTTSSVTVEQTFVTDKTKKTYDSSNISRTLIEESTEDKARAIDYEKPREKPSGEKPKPSPRQEDAKEPKDERPQKSPVDRTYRPTKPGASTWDGSFVYEKPEERKPSDKKTHPKDAADKPSPLKGKPSPSDVTGRKTVAISETSTDVTSSADYTTSSVTVEQTFVTDKTKKTYDSSNISRTLIEESTEDKARAIDYEKPREKPSGEKPKPSPRQEDAKEPKDERPQKSPIDRTHRPSKPGASTWDGSFVYEKPQDLRKKPTEPIEESKKPADQREKPTTTTTDKKTPQDVTKVRYTEDAADIAHVDITRASEVVQQSSYVIDQSSSFTSVQDVRNITDERVITEFTTDTRKDVRDVTESTKEFIDKEQVTSMVARDVVDDARFDTVTAPALRSPVDSTRKPSPERPGYPRGIPGLREDDRPKPIPAAGKPSRAPQRERSPQRPAEHGSRPSEVRPKSPEKLRDYVSPTRKPQPAAGKPSRPEEAVPVAPRKHDEERDRPARPAAGKPSRPAERPEKSKVPDVKPKRGDQSPDSLDEDTVHPEPIPDILSKIPLKEQCICELCTCGRHRCPHNLPQEHLEFPEEPVHVVTSYRQDYDEKRVEKQQKYYHEDHLRTEGEFIGERRSDYVVTKGERAPVKKPQDTLKPEGEWIGRPREEAPKYGERAPVTIPQDNLKLGGIFDATTTTELVFTGTPGERPIPIRRNTYTKIEGDFIDETTTRSQYIDHKSIQRAEIIKRTDNLTVGEGEFTGTSHVKEDFQTYVVEREPQRRPTYPEDTDRFYSKTDITDNATTTQEQYRTYIEKTLIGPEKRAPIKHAPTLKMEGEFERPKPEEFKPIERRTPIKHPDSLKMEGDFQRPKHEDYRPAQKPEVKKPVDNLRPDGDFERPKPEEFKPAERRTPIKHPDNLHPEGEFVGRPKKDTPLKGDRADVKRPKDTLRLEGDFQRPEYEEYRPAERPQVKKPTDNLRPDGEFERPKPEEFKPAERRTPIKYPDSLKMEGEFQVPEHEGYRPAERPVVKKPTDNLRPDGDFERPKPEEFKPAERRTPIKHPDNLHPEGEFVGRPKKDTPLKGDRADVKRPKDTLRLEGDFQRPEYEEYRPTERPQVKKPTDNLRPEGDFERPKPEEFKPTERRTPIKYPDSLKMEGEFQVPEHEGYRPAERPVVKKPTDNLRPDGDFERPKPEEFKPAERRTPIKHPDNLYPEGEFVGKPKEDTPLKGDRADVKKPKDTLRLEGDFQRPQHKEYRPAERPEVKKPKDNLRPDGEFERPKPEEFKPAERRTPIKHPDNLHPEGEFVGRPKEETPIKGDRADVKKPKDTLRLEGEFQVPEYEGYRPAERPEVKKPVDNLRPDGEFERPKPEEFKPSERRTPIKHPDNLHPEGEFIGKPKEDTPLKGDRADVKKPKDTLRLEGEFAKRTPLKKVEPVERRTPIKHEDNLQPEGDFYIVPKDDFTPKRGDRVPVKKPQDNLRPDGEFERPKPEEFKPAERRTPIKYPDSLKMEGEFEVPEHEVYRPAEKPEVKKPVDNLRPGGEFERPKPAEFKPAERRSPIRHPDNLHPEGEFIGKPKEDTPLKGDRADVKKPKDTLRLEGEFAKRTTPKKLEPVERRTPIKHEDNLQPEGDFYIVPKDDFTPKRGDRVPVKKPQDNLRPEGEMEVSPKDDYKRVNGERVVVRRHEDNLRMEGQIDIHRSRDDYKKITKVEKIDIKRHEDNIKMEGEFERPKPEEFKPAEKRTPIKHPDSLRMEGEFQRPEQDGYRPAERPEVKKPTDNLRPEGDFERPEKAPVGPAERRSPIKHPDNLRPEGEFVGRPKKDTPLKGDRADVKKPKDTLRLEGEFAKRTPEKVEPAERRTPIKHEDNLQPEGDFYIVPKDDFTPKRGDRVPVKKPQDNLRPEGEMEVSPKDDYKHVNGERVVVRRHEDNLRMEGQIDIHRSRDDYKKITKVEKVDIKRHEDNIKVEGEFIDVRRKDDYVQVVGERLPIMKHPDQLRLEGDFDRPQKTVMGPAERRTPIKHPDNLKPEGDFAQRPKEITPTKGDRAVVRKPKDNIKLEGEFDVERPASKSPVGPAERRLPIKHPDNLHPEGEFVGRPRKDTPLKGDRADVKKPKDTLRLEGEFAKRTTPKKVGPAERRTPIKHEDNLQPEGDFYIVPKDDFTPKRGERLPVKKPQDNLRPEGEMEVSPKNDYTYVNGERVEVRRHEDHLKIEGEVERPKPMEFKPAERRSPIKHPDSLKLEGEFQRPEHEGYRPAERPEVKKPTDNLRSEGDFERPEKAPIGPAERRSPIKHPDNLHLEGEFVGRPRKDTPLKGDRADVKKPRDTLRPEGEFAKRTPPKKMGPAERRSPIKHEDNLQPEGDFYIVPKDDFTPKRGDRVPVRKPQDNLRPEGEMEVSPKNDYKYVNGERVEVRRHEDNLRMEGQMDIHRSRDDYKKITRVDKVDIKRHEDTLKMEGEFIDIRRKDDYVHVRGERMPVKKHPDHLRPEGDFYRPQKTVVGPAERRTPIKHPDNLKPEGDFVGRPRDDFTPKRGERTEVVRREDNLKMTGDFEGTTSHKSTYTVVRGERADVKSHEDNLKLSSATMETKTTSRDTYTPSKQEVSPAGRTVNRRRHMESTFTLGDDTTVMTTTNQRNYNTYTKRAGKDVATKMSQMESDTRKTVESQTLQTDGTVVTTVRRATTSAQSDQRVANAHTVVNQQQTHVTDRRVTQPIDGPSYEPQPVDSQKATSAASSQHHEQHQRTQQSSEQHLRTQNVTQTRRNVEDRSITEALHHRGQIVRGEETSRHAIESGEHHRQHKQQQQQQLIDRYHQEVSKRDYVNTQHMESRQRSATKQHEQHTISSQARYHSSSPEFRQTINGQTSIEHSQVDSAANRSHHRKNVISSSSADISNAVLHRRGATTSTEALHTISSTAADQRKSISNLAESGQYISNSSQSSDRRSLTSLHRSSKDVNPWASSSYERPQRIVRQDNLTVGGKFYSQSEARNYGNFSQTTQKVERVQRQANVSNINLGDGSTVTSSMYKREYVPRHKGPCPAALLEAKQAPFKHTRDTRKHKFYMPVLTS